MLKRKTTLFVTLLILVCLFLGMTSAAASQDEQIMNIAEEYFHSIYDFRDKDICYYKALWDGSFSSQPETEYVLSFMFDFTYENKKIAIKCGDYNYEILKKSMYASDMLEAIKKLWAGQSELNSLLPDKTSVSCLLVCDDMELAFYPEQRSIEDALSEFSVILYSAGVHAYNDTIQAYEYFIQSADLGNPYGCYEVGLLRYNDQELPFMYDEQVIRWLVKAAQSGHVGSMVKLADIFEEGLISISDRNISAYWLGKAVSSVDAAELHDKYYSKYSDIVIPSYHQSGDYEYRLNDHGEAYITMYSGSDLNLVIPSEIDGYSIIGIDSHAFIWCDFYTVDIPDSITEIGDYAFMYCYQVTMIKLPANLTRMGCNPFLSCQNLQTYYISPDNPYFVVADNVLYNKKEKAMISYPSGHQNDLFSIPEGIVRIGPNAFYNAYLDTVILPESLEYIDHDAFFSGINITTVNIPSGVKEIGDRAFQRCLSLGNVTIPDHVSYLGERAFALCGSLTAVDLSSSLTEIKNETFEWCSLTQLTIPDTVEMLGSKAFAHCFHLTSVNLPNIVSFIGEDCFVDCPELMLTVERNTYGSEYAKNSQIRYQYPDSLSWLLDDTAAETNSVRTDSDSIDEGIHNNTSDKSETVFYAGDQTMHGVYILPSSNSNGNQYDTLNMDSIGCQNDLYVLQVPASYTHIGSKTFYDCSFLRTVIISETVNQIDEDLFDPEHGAVTFIAPADSFAAQYANNHNNINCIELPDASLNETDVDYLATLIYKNTPVLSAGFASHLDYLDYINEMDTRSLVRMGVANRNEIAFGWLVDLFDPGDSKQYLADSYRDNLFLILESMQNRESVRIDFSIPKTLTAYAAKATDKYLDFNAWLQGTDKNTLSRTDPYFSRYLAFSKELTNISKEIGNVQDTLKLIQFSFRDYSESQAILDVIEGMSEFDSSGTLTSAFTHLRNEFDEGIRGTFTYLIDEEITGQLKNFIEDGLKEIIGEPFKLYSTVNRMIDLGLTVTGEKDIADKEIEYVSLMNITIYAFDYYDELMQNGDNSPEAMEKLAILVPFIREAITRTYALEIELTDDVSKRNEWEDSMNYYRIHDDYIRYCVYGE